MVLAVEPMESLRYLGWLADDGAIVASVTPFVNIPNYPDLEEVLTVIRKHERHVLVDSKTLAKEAGNVRAENTVMLGAASRYLPIEAQVIRDELGEMFAPKGEKLVEVNRKAFDLGRAVE
jgi:indolepyruvate ferredoxin oxidoreductase beta subunit